VQICRTPFPLANNWLRIVISLRTEICHDEEFRFAGRVERVERGSIRANGSASRSLRRWWGIFPS